MNGQTEYISANWDDLSGVTPSVVTLDLLAHQSDFEQLLHHYHNTRLHHAWLLNGPRGIGKATFAYRFAEHVLRNSDPDQAPMTSAFLDDAIHSQVAKRGHPNVLTIARPYDPKSKKFKSQITVEEIRKISSFLQLASGAKSWRIVIVDAGDDLNTSSANALLKILEEPPEKTLFFVLAHSPRGMLATIRSRCQMLSLKPLPKEDLVTILKRQELTTDMADDELFTLADLAKGSARRALLLATHDTAGLFRQFEQCVTAAKPDISEIHRIAGKITPAAKSVEFKLFMELVYDYIGEQTNALSSREPVAFEKMHNYAQLWSKTREAEAMVETWNLDKKQVILDLFSDIRAC